MGSVTTWFFYKKKTLHTSKQAKKFLPSLFVWVPIGFWSDEINIFISINSFHDFEENNNLKFFETSICRLCECNVARDICNKDCWIVRIFFLKTSFSFKKTKTNRALSFRYFDIARVSWHRATLDLRGSLLCFGLKHSKNRCRLFVIVCWCCWTLKPILGTRTETKVMECSIAHSSQGFIFILQLLLLLLLLNMRELFLTEDCFFLLCF